MKTYGLSPERWLDLKNEIQAILIATAKANRTISYSSLTEAIMSVDLEPRSRILFAVLTEISEEENAAGRSMLSAVVIRKDRNMTRNSGFIKLAARLGRDVSDRKKCWNAEIDQVCKYWSAQGAKITHLISPNVTTSHRK